MRHASRRPGGRVCRTTTALFVTLVLAMLAPPRALGAQQPGVIRGAVARPDSGPAPARDRASASDTLRRRGAATPLGLPRVAFDTAAGVLGTIDTTDAPMLGAGGGVDALAARVAGARVYWPSGAPGTAPRVQLLGRGSLDRASTPLYVLDGVPLAAPMSDLETSGIDRIDVLSDAGGGPWFGSLARDGVVQLRRGDPLGGARGFSVSARSQVGTTWSPAGPALNRSHAWRVNASGQYIDADGNVVDRSQREPDGDDIADARFIGSVFDPHEAMIAPGLLTSASATIAGAAMRSRLTVTSGRDHEEGVLRGADGYTRTFVRAATEHRFHPSLSLSLTGYRAWSERDAFENDDRFAELYQFPVDVDLSAPATNGEYVAFPDGGWYGLNPLYAYAVRRAPVGGRRTILGAQAHWSPLGWMSVHAGIGHDDIAERSRYRVPLVGVDGSVSDTTFNRLTDERSLRTTALAISAARPLGPFDARVAIGWTSASLRDSSFVGQSTTSMCPSGPPCTWEAYSLSRLDLRQDAYSVHGALDFRGRFALAAGLRHETSDLLPADDDAALDHRLTASWFPTAESWWRWSGIDRAAVRLSRTTRTSLFSPLDIDVASFVLTTAGATLRPEEETAHELAIDLARGSRFEARLAHVRATTENALAVVPNNSPGGSTFVWRNAGRLGRRSTLLSVGAELLRGEWGTWSATLAADRSRLRIEDLGSSCYFGSRQHRCAGADAAHLYGVRWARRHADLPAQHAGSHDAFAINDDGLLVAVGVGGSLANPAYGTTVSIDGASYSWGMPIQTRQEDGSPFTRIGDANPDLSLGLSNVVRWRGFAVSATVVGQLGGDVYDAASQFRYSRRNHVDLDQSDDPVAERKPTSYYQWLASPFLYSDWFVRDGTRLSLEELSVSYRLVLGRRGFGAAEVVELSLIGRNLGGWSRHDWVGSADASPWPGSDELMYPRPRSLSLRVAVGR